MYKKLIYILIIPCLLLKSATSLDMPKKKPKDFNFILKYGHSAKNIINTFRNEFTKDLIIDGDTTSSLKLTSEEMDTIYQVMRKINILEYPDEFSPPDCDKSDPNLVHRVTPYSTYYFKIQINKKMKEIKWEDSNFSKAEKAVKLREIIDMIDKIIENKEEYKNLPKANGMYL